MNPPAPPAGPSSSTFPSHGATAHSPSENQQAQDAAATATAALSQEHTPTPNNTTASGRKRRASGAPGSRGVANLTPDQLAKKRANDREAQRAIRERTRNTIESLEKRIRELESQQPFQDLQVVVQERDHALAECEELRRRLGAITGIAGGQQPSLNELAALTAQQAPLPLASRSQSSPGSRYDNQLHPDLRSGTSQTLSGNQVESPEGTGSQKYDQSSNQQYTGTNRLLYDEQHSPSAPMQQPPPSNGDRLGLNFLLESTDHHQQQVNSTSPTNPSVARHSNEGQPRYARLTNIGPPSCPLDYLLLDAHKSLRKKLLDGASGEEAIGPEYPAFSTMMSTGPGPRPPCHQTSALLIDILSKFPDIARLPERVAVLYIMFLVLRWLICPCPKCYERLPEWCQPTLEQLERPHVAWGDYLPWPHMRRQIAISEREVKFEDFFVPYTTTLSLNWPLPQDCILLESSSANNSENSSGTLVLNPAFEYHLRNLDNWSVGSQFRASFPELVDASVRIKDV